MGEYISLNRICYLFGIDGDHLRTGREGGTNNVISKKNQSGETGDRLRRIGDGIPDRGIPGHGGVAKPATITVRPAKDVSVNLHLLACTKLPGSPDSGNS